MKTKTIIWIVVIILIIAGVFVWMNQKSSMTNTGANPSADQTTSTATPAVTVTTSPSPTISHPTVTVLAAAMSATLGEHLISNKGMTLYQYNKDSVGVSNCIGACAAAWPPYTTVSAAASLGGGTGVTGKIGTITRADGTMQVTYNGKPLYFFVSDKTSGDAIGQNVGGFTVVNP